jgi:hypothetical protein
MKTNIFSKAFKSSVIFLSFILISFSGLASDHPVNKNFNSIVDSISIKLKERYGYELKLDPSLKNGCINYSKEIRGNSIDEVEGEGHIHASAELPMEYYNLIPESFFYEVVIETIENPGFGDYFKVYVPTKFWVEEIVVGDKCYFVVAID